MMQSKDLPMNFLDVNLNQMNEQEVRSWLDAVGVGSADYPPNPKGWGEPYKYAWKVYEDLVERDAAEAASAVVAPRRLPEDRGDVDLDQMNEDEVRIWLDAVGVGSADN